MATQRDHTHDAATTGGGDAGARLPGPDREPDLPPQIVGEQRGEDAAAAAFRSHRPALPSRQSPDEPGWSPLLTVRDLSATVALAKTGDEDAFRVVYRAVQPGLFEYVRGLMAGDAAEVTAEVWLHVAREVWTFRGTSEDFRRWVAGIGRARALDLVRRLGREPALAPANEAALLRTAMGLSDAAAHRIVGADSGAPGVPGPA